MKGRIRHNYQDRSKFPLPTIDDDAKFVHPSGKGWENRALMIYEDIVFGNSFCKLARYYGVSRQAISQTFWRVHRRLSI